MFNDKLDVRDGNEKRKRALARVAQKLMQNSGRAGGLAGLSGRAGGGLGRQNSARFRPLAQRNMGQFARLAPGGNDAMGLAIGRFGITERMPGAYDPAATVPDLGGRPSDLPGLGSGGGAPGGASGSPRSFTDPYGNVTRFSDSGEPGTDLTTTPGGDTFTEMPQYTSSQPSPGGDYSGYIMYQGQLIPMSVYKAIMGDVG